MALTLTWRNETRKLSELVPWEKNPRKINDAEARRLAESLKSFGQVQTIAIGPDNEIYDGHQRAAVWGLLQSGGDQVVDVRVSSRALTEPERKKLVVYLHKGAHGEWDFDALAANFDFDDLVDWGFDATELQGVDFGNSEPAGEDPGADLDKAAELQAKWQVNPGDLWIMGEHRLICGDCTDPDVVARVMGGEKATLVVTSPPYAVGKEYETDVSFSQHIALLEHMADRCIESLIPGGFIFTNFDEIAALSHASPLTGSNRQCIYLISKDYWRIFHEERRCDLYAQRIWYKPFAKLQQPFWSYKTSIPHYQEWEHIWTWRTPGGDGDRPTDWDISSRAVWDTRHETSDDRPLTRHVAAFPLGIPERAIKAHSAYTEIVLEPFSGSGTTLIACDRLTRRCRAIEIEPKYCAVALERWSVLTGQTPTLDTP